MTFPSIRYEGRLCQAMVVAEVKQRLELAITELRKMNDGFEAIGADGTNAKLSNIIGRLLDQKEDLYYLYCELEQDMDKK